MDDSAIKPRALSAPIPDALRRVSLTSRKTDSERQENFAFDVFVFRCILLRLQQKWSIVLCCKSGSSTNLLSGSSPVILGYRHH